jgi:predicted CXXCH cytochrome family protein
MVLLFALTLLAGRAGGEPVPLSDESRKCLDCHAKPGIIKHFRNNESLIAYVDPDAFQASAHKSLACSSCHPDFSSGKHPTREFKTKAQYQIRSSLICRQCHTDEQIVKRPVHRGLLQEEKAGKPPVCTNCHGSHTVAPLSGKNSFTNEEQYCSKCHNHAMTMHFKNKETLSLKIDARLLKTSVHGKLSCSDCHFGFSSEEHPQRNFKTRRDFTLASSEGCRRCHFDKYTKTLESIHYTVLSQGKLNAPVCTDCHGSHEIYRVGKERTESAKRCQRCHSSEYDTYAKSVHGNALFNEHNQDVPVCVDCHTAHTIEDPLSMNYRERIPEMCSRCHAKKEIVGKYGLSTDVEKTYLSDFHGVSLGLYKMEKGKLEKPHRAIAVCTDCHGTHNIMNTRGTEASVVKTNLLKRCQKCHADANEHFPDAWLSHYEPSLKRAPLVFFAGLAYQIFIPIMLIGFVLQILLHIWRYAMNK